MFLRKRPNSHNRHFCFVGFFYKSFSNFLSVTDYHATPYDWEQARVNEAPFGYRSTHAASGGNDVDYLSHMLNHGAAGIAEDLCPTRASVLGLAVTCAMLYAYRHMTWGAHPRCNWLHRLYYSSHCSSTRQIIKLINVYYLNKPLDNLSCVGHFMELRKCPRRGLELRTQPQL